MGKFVSVVALLILSAHWQVLAQAGGGMKLGQNYTAYVDSIKRSDYKWVFPILGKRLSKKGFDLQYPLGIMVNPFVGSQQVAISDLKVGFNGNPPVALDFIKFGEVKAIARSATVRPDIWILPFLDIYGVGGATWTQTKVQITAPAAFNTSASFSGTTFGIGATLAGGYHGIIGIFDVNHTWTTLSDIEGSVQTTMFTPRLGYNFLFPKRPGRNIAFWVGAPAIFVNRNTEGSIDVSKLRGLPAQDGIINYSLKKRPVSTWSMCVGGQIQINHHWQFRTETGFFGGRSSLLVSANYRWRK